MLLSIFISIFPIQQRHIHILEYPTGWFQKRHQGKLHKAEKLAAKQSEEARGCTFPTGGWSNVHVIQDFASENFSEGRKTPLSLGVFFFKRIFSSSSPIILHFSGKIPLSWVLQGALIVAMVELKRQRLVYCE